MAIFTTEEKDGIHIIKCPSIIDVSAGLDAEVKAWLEKAPLIHVIDFTGVLDFREKAYRPFIQFNQVLKSVGKRLFVINLSQKLLAQFKQGGLAASFVVAQNLADAVNKAKPAGAKPGLDVEFINPFVTATQTVLGTQCNIKLNPSRPYIKKPEDKLPMEIAGVISLTAIKFTGTISLCFRAEVFLKIYESMVGEKHEKITPELEDAAGELLNMIFGQAKTILNDQKGYTLEKALPTVMTGDGLKLSHNPGSPVVVLPFESSVGNFHIEVMAERG